MPNPHRPELSAESHRAGQRTLTAAAVAVAAALIASAAPALAAPAAAAGHHHPHHHSRPHLKHAVIDGLVRSVHHRKVTVFASSEKVGRRTSHNTVVHLVLPRHTRRSRAIRKGYLLHLVASVHGAKGHLVIRRLRHQRVTPSPAAVIVGVVDRVSPDLVVSQYSRDYGEHGRSEASHRVTVNDSAATVTVDGAPGTLGGGDLVAVLGEATGTSVLASRVYAFTGEAESLRGQVVAINGDDVTVRSEGFDTTVALGSGSGRVPLFVDGAGATPDQLRVHDRLVVLGVVSEDEESFVPEVGFGFDGHDHRPCGDNPRPRHRHHH